MCFGGGGGGGGGEAGGVIVIPVNQLLWEFPKGAVSLEDCGVCHIFPS